VAGVGEYDFGADITENQSCDQALTNAEADAIERAFGVTVGATDWEMCDNETCDFRSMSWIETHGHVVEIKNINKVILENPRRCRVSIVADVEQTPTINPNFTLDVELNRTQYKAGDELYINLDPSQSMYVAVFNWSDVHGFILMDYKQIDKSIRLPDDPRYKFKTYINDNKPSEEMIVVLASKSQMNFKLKYDTNEFVMLSQKLAKMGVLVRKISFTINP
tara:strand:- start:247 stop:909 length:663 start_codon:yes stop_codon:yes gene_type:complete